jgi:hypothetical protein
MGGNSQYLVWLCGWSGGRDSNSRKPAWEAGCRGCYRVSVGHIWHDYGHSAPGRVTSEHHGSHRSAPNRTQGGPTDPRQTHGCYAALMTWTLPLPLLLFAGVVALVPLIALVRRPTSVPRLIVEVFTGTLAVIAVL